MSIIAFRAQKRALLGMEKAKSPGEHRRAKSMIDRLYNKMAEDASIKTGFMAQSSEFWSTSTFSLFSPRSFELLNKIDGQSNPEGPDDHTSVLN
ncbi:MAG: hypothetical protein C4519_20960 [Desulfobacteraceae bacterium]|nr:MAG: hypothetical protein C4519_20960 [Desulfobacteraceae bacterium]